MTTYKVEGTSGGTLYQVWEWIAMWRGLLTGAAAFGRTQPSQQLSREEVVEINLFPSLSSRFDFLPMPSLAESNWKPEGKEALLRRAL